MVQWWHYLVSHFVHGRGADCGFPSTTVHLAINGALFLFHGTLAERLLGSARIALLTFFCLAVQIALMHALIDGRGHGASGMTWSYVPFVLEWLAWSWRRQRWAMFKDWIGCVLFLLTLLALVGLIKHWHLWTLRANIDAADRGAPLDRGIRLGSLAGAATAAAIFAFNAFFVGAAAKGAIQPMSVECRELEGAAVPCVIDYGRSEPGEVAVDLEVLCENDARRGHRRQTHGAALARGDRRGLR